LNSRDRFLSACRQESVDKTPVWFMRQAGRYLPGYKAVRKDLSVIDICKTPQVCKQVTLMPIHELGVDVAVMFADIMLPLEGIGIKFRIEESIGPMISNPISSREDAETLTTFDAKRDVPFVLEAIGQVKTSLEGKTALVGFSGAPFTIASYLIEGQPSRDFTKTKKLMFNDKEAWDALMTRLTDTISDYLSAQIKAGVDAVQLFDSWVGALCKEDYLRFVLPHVSMIFKRMRSDNPDIPTIHFATNSAHLLESMRQAGGEIFSIDWRTPISQARSILGKVGIQGNLEPAVLLSNDRNGFISNRTQMVLDDNAGKVGHIFNLGHGILRDTPVENAKFVVDYVHEHS
jgi:uroporphyrinogen decarboxylase